MKTLRLRPLLTGGSLTATRCPSCAAAADSIVTFGPFVEIHAAWVGGGWQEAARQPSGYVTSVRRQSRRRLSNGKPRPTRTSGFFGRVLRPRRPLYEARHEVRVSQRLALSV